MALPFDTSSNSISCSTKKKAAHTHTHTPCKEGGVYSVTGVFVRFDVCLTQVMFRFHRDGAHFNTFSMWGEMPGAEATQGQGSGVGRPCQ